MIRVTDKQYWMDGYLKKVLDTAIYNNSKDWDFLFLVTGSGLVRVGKSMIAKQCAYYVSYQTGKPFDINNVVFSASELIEKGHKLPAGSCIVYDEAKADLNPRTVNKAIMDYLSECGMYNHFMFFVMPDVFEFPKRLVVNRSDALINVERSVSKKMFNGSEVNSFERGHFRFLNRNSKRRFYLYGKKDFDSYDSIGKFEDFHGEFRNYWVVDKDAYELKKVQYLKRDREKREQENVKDVRQPIAVKLKESGKFTYKEIAELMDISEMTVSRYVRGVKSPF